MKNNRHCCTKAGFSLIELLISLITISLIVTAFVPVLTKKSKYKDVTISKSAADCKKFGDGCIVCNKTQCFLTKDSLDYLVQNTFDCKKFGSDCISCNQTECFLTKSSIVCPNGQYKNQNKCEACASPCAGCSGSASFCTSCIQGYNLVNNKCKKFTDVPCVVIGGICVTKYNAGDYQGLAVPEPDVLVSGTVYSNYFNSHAGLICWKGQTASPCDTANGSYSGCYRTVCTYTAAQKICSYHGWRLPSQAELAYFAGYSLGLGERGLQLCDKAAGYNSAQCASLNTCPNSVSGCHPFFVWAQGGFDYYLENGSYVPNAANAYSWALSVRCVRDLY